MKGTIIHLEDESWKIMSIKWEERRYSIEDLTKLQTEGVLEWWQIHYADLLQIIEDAYKRDTNIENIHGTVCATMNDDIDSAVQVAVIIESTFVYAFCKVHKLGESDAIKILMKQVMWWSGLLFLLYKQAEGENFEDKKVSFLKLLQEKTKLNLKNMSVINWKKSSSCPVWHLSEKKNWILQLYDISSNKYLPALQNFIEKEWIKAPEDIKDDPVLMTYYWFEYKNKETS